MGRFYADLNRLKQDEIFNTAMLHSKLESMPLVESFFKPALSTDRDGDVVMADARLSSSPVSPFKEKFSFDWFKFDGNGSSTPKSPTFSPVSPATTSRKLSVSTASPTSYFHDDSPVTPATPEKSITKSSHATTSRSGASHLVLPTPPSKPLNWVWQCHQCRSRYQLSVTRRCLIDGHYYCSGDNSQTQRNNKRRRKASSCTSEFDYVGWQEWGQWRRKCTALRSYANGKAAPKLHGCEGCSFPSQCRYESRPPVETVEFEKYIDAKDIAAMKENEVEQSISPEKAAFTEELGRAGKEKDSHNLTKSAKKKVQKLAKLESSGEKSLQKIPSEKGSKRQRFYSSLAGNTSSADLSPTRESSNPFDRGKFDTSLPSLGVTSDKPNTTNIPIDPALTAEGHGHPSGKHTDLEAIEATLKAALAGQKPKSTSTSSASTTSPRTQSQSSSSSSTPIFKRRVNSKSNSKPNNPEFEVTPSDILNSTITTANNTKAPISPNTQSTLTLPRTDSQQSLLTDFFRQGKHHKDRDVENSKSHRESTRRATSEADIASFLQLRTGRDPTTSDTSSSNRPETQRANTYTHTYDSSNGGGAKDFEDINLSPVAAGASQKPGSGSSENGAGAGTGFGFEFETTGDMDVDVDPVKKMPPTVEPGSSGERGGGAFGLLNFGFGRK